uniref:CBF1-interacting co-repressor CIR N-terminal domain-containing protein n=1 Tax=Timema genevievae TaxID=629358 RepID=A0A7R9JYI8_TIMGE|nr:unnamed protein product [Timema genevievae]
MGGGDLNLKKSWHPSTMRNMEKVWKAEQRHDQEKRRIAELQREIRAEKTREDIQKFAEDTGVVEKKDDMKLDWMYKGPSGIVDREEYLLGRRIDKTFEQLEQSEKASTSSAKNSVEYDCVPSSIFSGGNEQVDIARKLQEDPLCLIKKKELETRTQILNNPVKLKQLQEMLRQQKHGKGKKDKKQKKKSKKKQKQQSSESSDSDSNSVDLDALLVAKYNKLKEKLHKTDMVKLGRAESSSSDSEEDNNHREKKQTLSVVHRKRKHDRHYSSEDDEKTSQMSRGYGLVLPDSKKHLSSREPSHGKNKHREDQRVTQKQSEPEATKPWVRTERKKLSEEDLERKRLEMMDNAKWREAVREKNIAKYKAEDRKEKKDNRKTFDKDFLRKQLSYAASKSSVEGRIKANINNIQRSGRSMGENFARR